MAGVWTWLGQFSDLVRLNLGSEEWVAIEDGKSIPGWGEARWEWEQEHRLLPTLESESGPTPGFPRQYEALEIFQYERVKAFHKIKSFSQDRESLRPRGAGMVWDYLMQRKCKEVCDPNSFELTTIHSSWYLKSLCYEHLGLGKIL